MLMTEKLSLEINVLKYFTESYHQTEKKHKAVEPGSKHVCVIFEYSTITPEIYWNSVLKHLTTAKLLS